MDERRALDEGSAAMEYARRIQKAHGRLRPWDVVPTVYLATWCERWRLLLGVPLLLWGFWEWVWVEIEERMFSDDRECGIPLLAAVILVCAILLVVLASRLTCVSGRVGGSR